MQMGDEYYVNGKPATAEEIVKIKEHRALFDKKMEVFQEGMFRFQQRMPLFPRHVNFKEHMKGFKERMKGFNENMKTFQSNMNVFNERIELAKQLDKDIEDLKKQGVAEDWAQLARDMVEAEKAAEEHMRAIEKLDKEQRLLEKQSGPAVVRALKENEDAVQHHVEEIKKIRLPLTVREHTQL